MNSVWGAIAVLVASGFLMSTQAIVNARLSVGLGIPTFNVVFSAIQFLFSLIPLMIMSDYRFSQMANQPLWMYVGAPLGVVILSTMAFGLTRAGATTGFVSVLFGQLLMSVVIDYFGLFGTASQSISTSRAFGLALVALGVYFIR